MTEGSMTRFNLLIEPIIRVRLGDREQHKSLPQVLEALGGDQDIDFLALRAHQRHAWHAFLVQLAAMALHRADEDNPRQTAGRWLDLLRQMSDGQNEAWCLVVDDLSKPAFMQPPVPEGSTGSWTQNRTPPNIDALMLAKNHDLKKHTICFSGPEHWVFALVNVQTTESYFLKHNGSIRMKGRTASRPFVSITRSIDLNDRFKKEVSRILRCRDRLFDQGLPYCRKGGLSLLWLESWDGNKQLYIDTLDPFFIEVCQRIRLSMGQNQGDVVAYVGTSSRERVEGLSLKGATGDPWCPIHIVDEIAALNIRKGGFNYKLCAGLIFSGDYKLGIAGDIVSPNEPQVFIAASQARDGQKRISEGYHERIINLPGRVCSLFGNRDSRDRLAAFSRKRIETSDIVRRKVLHMALCMVTQGAPDEKLDFRDDKTERWLSNLDREIDSVFFDRLFSDLDLDDDEAADAWARELIDLALAQLEDALRSIPQPSIRRYRIESAARGLFFGLARKHFPDLYEDIKQGGANA